MMATAAIASAAPSDRLLFDMAVLLSVGKWTDCGRVVYNLMKKLTNNRANISGKVAPLFIPGTAGQHF